MIQTAALVLTALLADQDPLPKLVIDKDPSRRLQAVDAVQRSRDPRQAALLVPLLADPHPRVRVRTVRALQAAADPDLLLKALAHPQPLVRQGSCEALGLRGDRAALPDLLERLGDGHAEVQGEAARAVGLLGDRSAAERLADAFRRDSDGPLRAFALEAMGRLDPSTAAAVLETAVEDRAHATRIVAAEVAALAGRPELLDRLIQDRDWRVRAAAIEASRLHRERPSIGRLVDQLGRETGRLRWDIVQALHDLAERDLGLAPGPWKAWWEANRETFPVRPSGAKGGGPQVGGTQASFFSIPILSTRMVFVLDLSGSMRDPEPGGARTKLDAAKAGILETVRGLPADARFGIFGLGCDETGAWPLKEKKTWGGKLALRPAQPPLKADADRFVRGLEAKGWTNLYDGLEFALSDPEADTVFLYSDGGASKGSFVASGEILSQLAKLNRFRRTVVHTVEVPGERNPEDNRRLLASIATSTGGVARLSEKK